MTLQLVDEFAAWCRTFAVPAGHLAKVTCTPTHY